MNALIQQDFTPKYVVMRELAREVPLDNYGLPKFIYRSDLIPATILDGDVTPQERHQYLSSATIAINYDEGFPTLKNGDAIWYMLPWETGDAYMAFDQYIRMVEPDETPLRMLSVLSTKMSVPLDTLQSFFHEYWWRARAAAYDLFIVACQNKLQNKRIARMNDTHYIHANEFIELATSWIKGELEKASKPDGGAVDIKFRDMVSLLDMGMRAQRVSLGQPAAGYSGATASLNSRPAQSVEVMMRSLSAENVEVAIEGQDHTQTDIRKLLQDPKLVGAAQEIVIRMTSAMEGDRDRAGSHFLDRHILDNEDT